MDDRRFALKLLIFMCTVVFVGCTVEFAIDFSRAVDPATGKPLTLHDLQFTPAMIRSVTSPIARAYNNTLALILTFIGLAIPITANMYTPKLIEIFVRDKVNLVVLCLYAALTAHSILAVTLSFDKYAGVIPFWITFFGAILGWTIILPYYFYVLSFLNPTTIIARVEKNVIDEFRVAARGRLPVAEGQRRLSVRITHLGSVLLKAVDRGDRDVSVDAVRAHMAAVRRFQEFKPKIAPGFFEVDDTIMVGMSNAALKIVNRAQIWVEQRIAHQLLLAFNGALGKMPDGVSVIADAVKDEAVRQAGHGEPEVLELLLRVFNTFIREAVKKKDAFSIYNLFYNYKSLARKLMPVRPGKIPEIARHFRYYADFAKQQGLPFIYELASYELGELCEHAYEQAHPGEGRELLEAMVAFEGATASRGLVKGRAILGGYFLERGMAPELDRLVESLRPVPASILEGARRELFAVKDRVFWEITDRGVNFDYVEEARRERVKELFDRLAAPPPPPQPAAPAPAPTAAGARS